MRAHCIEQVAHPLRCIQRRYNVALDADKNALGLSSRAYLFHTVDQAIKGAGEMVVGVRPPVPVWVDASRPYIYKTRIKLPANTYQRLHATNAFSACRLIGVDQTLVPAIRLRNHQA